MHLLSARQSKREVERLLKQARHRERAAAQESRQRQSTRRARPIVSVVALAAVGAFVAAFALPMLAGTVAADSTSAMSLDSAVPSGSTQSLEVSAAAPRLSREDVEATDVFESYAMTVGLPSLPCDANSAGTLRWPLDSGCIVSSGFGSRFDGYYGATAFHAGVDLAPGGNPPVHAVADGVVTEVGDDSWGYGTHVVVWHPKWRVATMYGHMIYGSYGDLQVGDRVRIGDELGLVGSTGKSTGNHLHFEVRVDGGLGTLTPVDPVQWMDEHLR